MRLQYVEEEQLSTPGSAIHREDLQKITALAARLQEERKDQLSPEEVEAIGQELGIAPEFMRAAIAQLQTPPVEIRVSQPVQQVQQVQTQAHKRSRWILVVALALGAWLLIVSVYLSSARRAPQVAIPATVIEEAPPSTPAPIPLR